MRRAARTAAAAAPLLLAGCKSAATLTALATGAVAGGATGNPAVGYAVAIGTAAAADQFLIWYGRSRANTEQQAITDVAAKLPQGGAAPWQVHHFLPYGDEHGEVRVVGRIATPLADCRRIVFSVLDGKAPPHWFETTICHDTQSWRWALAEPAVARWGYLQQLP